MKGRLTVSLESVMTKAPALRRFTCYVVGGISIRISTNQTFSTTTPYKKPLSAPWRWAFVLYPARPPEHSVCSINICQREGGREGREGDGNRFCQIHSIERHSCTCPSNSLSPSVSQSIFGHKTKRYLQDSEFESQSNFLNLTVVNFYILPRNNLIKNKEQHLLFKFSFLSPLLPYGGGGTVKRLR